MEYFKNIFKFVYGKNERYIHRATKYNSSHDR